MKKENLQFMPDGSKPVAAPLRSLFLAITQAALASSLGAGCETDSDDSSPMDSGTDAGDAGSIDGGEAIRDGGRDAARDATLDAALRPGFERISCVEGAAVADSELKTSAAVDYLGAFHSYLGQELPSDAGTRQTWTQEEARHQRACAGLADPAPCQAQLTTMRAATQCQAEPCPPFLIGQQAGVLSRLDTRADVLALLGSIDTEAEAVLLTAFSGQPLCDFSSRLPGASIAPTANGYEIEVLYERCSMGQFRDRVAVDRDGTVTILEHTKVGPYTCAVGRRPDGLQTSGGLPRTSPLGAYLAEVAHLEAASVYAFEKLARELLALSAPYALIEAAREALADEVRHARAVGALARASGGRLHAPVVQKTPLRSRLELALDNATEGCVRETFGALVATYQAQTARDQRVRSVMATIAEDETRHAALSWTLQAWLEADLSEHELSQVASARARALEELERELDSGLTSEHLRTLGLPTAATSASLLADMREALPWTRSAADSVALS